MQVFCCCLHGVVLGLLNPLLAMVWSSGRVVKLCSMELTDRAWLVVQNAREEASDLGDDWVGSDHILLSMLRDGNGAAAYVLQDLGISYDEVLERLVSNA